MAALITLLIFGGVGVAMYLIYTSSRVFTRTWRPPNGGLGSGYPDSLNAWKLAENAVPRPPWPIDEDGNPIDLDETTEGGKKLQ